MKIISIFCSAMLLCCSAFAGIDLSIEKDSLELGVTAPVNTSTYLYIGGDTNEWVGMGLGYRTLIASNLMLSAYYEYGIKNDWLLDEIADIDGVKTNTHLLDLSATHFFEGYSVKFGLKGELIRNGFTWITVDDANKYSVYLSGTKYFQHAYIASTFEYHYAQDKSDMLNFNQGQATEFDISVGASTRDWYILPYAKVSVFSPNGSYYGMQKNDYSWTVGGRVSF